MLKFILNGALAVCVIACVDQGITHVERQHYWKAAVALLLGIFDGLVLLARLVA